MNGAKIRTTEANLCKELKTMNIDQNLRILVLKNKSACSLYQTPFNNSETAQLSYQLSHGQ